MLQFAFEAIGTRWLIEVFDPPESAAKAALQEAIQTRIEIFDQTYSRFRPDSLVMKMSQQAGEYTLPADAEPLMALYQQLYQISGGVFTPLIGQVLREAGYDEHYSLKPGTVTKPPKWEDVIAYQPPTLILQQPALLDFGAAGKGYLVDLVARVLAEHGLVSFCVDAGGDLVYRHADNQPFTVGLEHPANFQQVIGVATITNQSLCASAGNRRSWGEWHHLINPQTLTSPKDIGATWVVANTGLLADALATALFFVPAATLEQHFSFEYLVLKSDFTVEMSRDFPAELFYNDQDADAAPDR